MSVPSISWKFGTLFKLIGIFRNPGNWAQELDWAIRHLKKSGFPSSLYKLGMAGAVYHIWRARNECIFGNKQPFPEGVSDQIMKDVRDSLY